MEVSLLSLDTDGIDSCIMDAPKVRLRFVVPWVNVWQLRFRR
jgi:hypothetical protein